MKRERIFERDRYRCVYCGGVFPAEELTVDHVQARVRRGDRSAGNLVTACSGCNTAKGHRKAAQFLRDNSRARENFLRYARHVWPRLLREIRDLTARARTADPQRHGRRGVLGGGE